MRASYRKFEPITLLCVRRTGAYGAVAADAWGAMEQRLSNINASQRVKVRYGLMWDDPKTTDVDLLRYDACVPAMPGLEAEHTSGIRRMTMAGGAYLVHTHLGSYGMTGELFARIYKQVLPTRGLELDADRPFMTMHLNHPSVTRELYLRTEICVPVIPLLMPVANNDDIAETDFALTHMTG